MIKITEIVPATQSKKFVADWIKQGILESSILPLRKSVLSTQQLFDHKIHRSLAKVFPAVNAKIKNV
ncbi:MAG: hypothetical protein ACPHY8_02190 [Patescibacteria group bacterium]